MIQHLRLSVNSVADDMEYFNPRLDSMIISMGNSNGCGLCLHSDAGEDNCDDSLITQNVDLGRTECIEGKRWRLSLLSS